MSFIRKTQTEHGLRYIMCITQAQLETWKDLNSRQRPDREPMLIGGNKSEAGFGPFRGWYLYADAVEIVEPDSKEVDMITGNWFTMTIGILPDGSSHS